MGAGLGAGRCARALGAAVFAAVCVLAAVQGHIMMSGVPVPPWALATGLLATGAMAWRLTGRERGLLVTGSVAVATQVVLHALFSLAQAVVGAGAGAAGGEASLVRRWVRQVLCLPPEPGAPPGGPGHNGRSGSSGYSVSDPASGSNSGSGSDSAYASYVAGYPAGHAAPITSGAAGPTAPAGSTGHPLARGGADTDIPGATDAMGTVDATGAMDTMAHAGHAMGSMSPAGMLATHLSLALLCALWLAFGERAAFRILRVLAGWLAAPLRLLFRPPAPPHRPRVRGRGGRTGHALPQLLLLVHAITSRGPPAGAAVR